MLRFSVRPCWPWTLTLTVTFEKLIISLVCDAKFHENRTCTVYFSRNHNEVNERTNKQTNKQTVLLKHNRPRPVLRIAASRGFSELTKNVIRSSHGHSTPSLKISCKSVQPFSRNLADKETYKQRNRSKTIPRSRYTIGGWVTNKLASRHLGFCRTGNSAIRSADLENPTVELNMKWIGRPLAEIWPFEIFRNVRSMVGRRSVLNIYFFLQWSHILSSSLL